MKYIEVQLASEQVCCGHKHQTLSDAINCRRLWLRELLNPRDYDGETHNAQPRLTLAILEDHR